MRHHYDLAKPPLNLLAGAIECLPDELPFNSSELAYAVELEVSTTCKPLPLPNQSFKSCLDQLYELAGLPFVDDNMTVPEQDLNDIYEKITSLKLTDEELQASEQETQDQKHGSRWEDERVRRITSSIVHRILM